MSTDTKRYLDVILRYAPPQSVAGITLISSNGVTTKWFNVRDRLGMLALCDLADKRSNVYLRLTPLAQPPSKGRGLEAASLGSSVLWVDIDTRTVDARADALAALASSQQPPTMIVDSGYGLHAYWSLEAFSDDLDTIKGANKALAANYNLATDTDLADSCYDLARVLRIPGTYNLKHTPPVPCSIITLEPKRVYKLADFPKLAVDDATSIVHWDKEPLRSDFLEQLRDTDPKLLKRILTEEGARKQEAPLNGDGGVDRSRNDAYVCMRLLGLGYSPATLLTLLTHEEWFTGAKYQDTSRYDYVLTTVNKAWQTYSTSVDRYFIKNTFQAEALAKEVQQEHAFIYTGEQLWRYTTGVYIPDGIEYLKQLLIKRLGKRWSSRSADEVIRWVMDQAGLALEQCNQHEGMINVQNGMLDLQTGELSPHDPKYRSLAQLPISFNPKANPRTIDQFLARILPLDTIPVFWEYVGSALITDRYWPKSFLALVGPGDTGKSKVLEWLVHFYGGKQTVATLSLQTLADNKFSSSVLLGKFANIFSDLDEAEANNTGQIKALTGDDNIAGERKFGGFFTFKNTARLFFSANHYPRVRNPDDAFFNRAVIIRCDQKFTKATADPKIVAKLLTDQALSGALLRAYEGLQRLLAQNGLSDSPSITEATNEYRFLADTVAGFIQGCVFDADYAIPKAQLYAIYKATCESHNRRAVSDDLFYKRVADNLDRFGMTAEYRTIPHTPDGSRAWYYVGRKPVQTSVPYYIGVN